jgi:hypothetical protein
VEAAAKPFAKDAAIVATARAAAARKTMVKSVASM